MSDRRFLNNCRWNASSSGDGDFVVDSAVDGGYTPDQCARPAVVNGARYRYFAYNGSEHEEGYGPYNTGTDTLARTTIRSSSNSNAKVTFTGVPVVVMGGPVSDDMRVYDEINHALMMMGLSAAAQSALIHADEFADSFDDLTYVDDAGATDLEPGEAGVLKPTTNAAVKHTVSSTISDFSGGSGSAAAVFDGTTGAGFSGNGFLNGTGDTAGYVGANFSAAPKKIASAKIYGPNDTGFVNGSNPSITATLRAKNGGAPSGPTDGTTLGSITFTDTGNESAGREITSNDAATGWDYVWVDYSATVGAGGFQFVEIEFFPPITFDNLTVFSEGVPYVNAPNLMVLCAKVLENESVTENTDYKGYVSRNGGSDFAEVTFRIIMTDPVSGCVVLESDPVDVSGQTSPSALRWQFTTHNNKDVELHGVFMRAYP